MEENTMKKSKSLEGLEKIRNAVLIQRRLSNAVLEEKKKLEYEGYEVPGTSIYVQGDTRIKWQPEKYFNKNYKCYLNEIKKKYALSLTEIGIIYTLSFHVGYEDNMLSKSNGDPLLKKDLTEILGVAHNAVDKYMNALVTKGVLAKVKIKRSVNYYLNPRICYQGNRIDKTLLTMFNISI
jgi:DNA-binding MarR family transcriptional regulator